MAMSAISSCVGWVSRCGAPPSEDPGVTRVRRIAWTALTVLGAGGGALVATAPCGGTGTLFGVGALTADGIGLILASFTSARAMFFGCNACQPSDEQIAIANLAASNLPGTVRANPQDISAYPYLRQTLA
jgi:hypothetical protein